MRRLIVGIALAAVLLGGGTIVDAKPGSGDVNCNGFVDAKDAQLILQAEASIIPISAIHCVTWGDMDDDFDIDAIDALLILQGTASAS